MTVGNVVLSVVLGVLSSLVATLIWAGIGALYNSRTTKNAIRQTTTLYFRRNSLNYNPGQILITVTPQLVENTEEYYYKVLELNNKFLTKRVCDDLIDAVYNYFQFISNNINQRVDVSAYIANINEILNKL